MSWLNLTRCCASQQQRVVLGDGRVRREREPSYDTDEELSADVLDPGAGTGVGCHLGDQSELRGVVQVEPEIAGDVGGGGRGGADGLQRPASRFSAGSPPWAIRYGSAYVLSPCSADVVLDLLLGTEQHQVDRIGCDLLVGPVALGRRPPAFSASRASADHRIR